MDIQSQEGRDFWIGVVVSVALHGVIVLLVLVIWVFDQAGVPDAEEEEKSVEVILEDDPVEEPPRPVELAVAESVDEEAPRLEIVDTEEDTSEETTEEEVVEEEEKDPEEEEEEVVEEEEEESSEEPAPEPEPMERYAVEQQTNEEEPEEADNISDEANRVEEEMVSDTTTLEDIEEPEEDPEAPEEEADTELEMAMQTPQELSEPDILDPSILEEEMPDEEEDMEDVEALAIEEQEEDPADEQENEERQEEVAEIESVREYRDPSEMLPREDYREEAPADSDEPARDRLFGRDYAQAQELYGAREDEAGSESSGAAAPQGRRLLTNWRDNEEAMRASLENFLPNVETGNHTSVNAQAAPHASYLAGIHRSIHAAWAMGFIPRVQASYPSRDPINDMSLRAVVEIVIDAETGEVLETGLAAPAGHTLFNAEALTVSQKIGSQPDPPPSIVSPDGKVYIHWTYWRDQRQCGTFGARIFRVQAEEEQREVGGE